MREFHEIVQIMEHRKSAQSPIIREMLEVQKRYHADYVIPLPDVEEQPNLPPLTPALVANAIDAPALTAAQVLPAVFCPPIDVSKLEGRRSREYARKREHAIKSTFHANKLRLQMYRWYRHLSGYAVNFMVTRPGWMAGHPIIEVRDPLHTYPEPKAPEDMSRLNDCGFIHRRSAGWIRRTFPNACQEYGGPVPPEHADADELWDVIEWWDDEQQAWGLLGPSHVTGTTYDGFAGSEQLLLARFRNHTGACPVSTGPRITLDRVATQVAHNTGIIDFMGRLLTLDMIAAERNVFPDRYIIGDQNQMVRIVTNGGEWADGRTGQTNVIEGARAIGELRSQPDPATRAAYDTLERNYKVSTGQFGAQQGENTSNLRTGRALAEIYGMSVDPRVIELQTIAEHSLAEVGEDVLRCWERCWPDKKVTLFAGFAGNRAIDELKPAEHIEGEYRNAFSYAIPGADVQGTTITLGQLYGTDAISLKTMREKHPYIDDPELEARNVEEEKIERAMYDTLLMRAQNGEVPLPYLAMVAEKIREGEPIHLAVKAADEELRRQQAAAPPEVPAEDPALVPPEMMPGIEAGGPMAAAMAAAGAAPPDAPPTGPPIGPTDGQVGLDQLMSAIRGGT